MSLLTSLRVRVDNTTAQRRVRACARLDPAKKKLGEEGGEKKEEEEEEEGGYI